MPGGLPDEDDVDEEVASAGAGAATPPDGRSRPAGRVDGPPGALGASHRAPGWDEDGEEPADEPPRQFRRRERDSVGPVAPGRAGGKAAGGPAPEWERAKPLEAYPTLRSRRLPELSVPPVLVGVVALALAAAVLFALPGLLGFGNPSADSSASPTTPIITAKPSFNPTPIPQPTPTIYVVQAGDTLSRIAGRYGIALADLIAANAETLPDPDTLQIGDRLVIPVPLATEIPAASEIPGRDLPGAWVEARVSDLARCEVDARDLAGLDAERGVEVLARCAGADAEHIRLIGDPEIPHFAGDHLEPGLGAQEPAPDLLDATQRPGVVADVDAHLDLLVEERHRTGAIALVEQLEERFHRVDSTHTVPSVCVERGETECR